MANTVENPTTPGPLAGQLTRRPIRAALRSYLPLLITILVLALLPFVVGLLSGQSLAAILGNQSGVSKFVQGVAIEIFIMAAYALSYDLILGITGLLSFGHAMFFAVGAYMTGILLKSFGWSIWATLAAVVLASVVQALLFGLVLPRVKGVTFALVTLGMASVFSIVIQSSELGSYTGADVGLQGVIVPDFLNPATQRLRMYFIAMIFLFAAYLLVVRFVSSPTGRVCIAIRENEDRARMLGYNTFFFKLAALTLASLVAALAGALFAITQPIVTPYVASMTYTVVAILAILIGGVGTLSGAIIGAAIYRLLEIGLQQYIGESSSFVTGAIYILIVLFVPYGIVGTWFAKRQQVQAAREKLLGMVIKREGGSPK